jgi:hypothetical protein
MISYSRRGPNTSGMQLAELFYPGDTAKIRLARQVGITHAFYSVPTVLARVPRSEYVRELKRVQAEPRIGGPDFRGRGKPPRACREDKARPAWA